MRIRVTGTNPKAKRPKFRCPDASGNPHLAFSPMLMTGLDRTKHTYDASTLSAGGLATHAFTRLHVGRPHGLTAPSPDSVTIRPMRVRAARTVPSRLTL